MISRRLIRIKVLQIIYAYYVADKPSIAKFEKELFFSLNKTYDLYHYLLLLIHDIQLYAESRIDIARQKKIPSYEDLHPNTKFVDNRIIKQIAENEELENYLNEKKLSWVNYPELIKQLFLDLKKSNFFFFFLENNLGSYN